MVRKQFKHYVQLGILLLGIPLLLTNCEKDDSFLKEESSTQHLHTPKYTTSVVYTKAINENENLTKTLNKLRGTKIPNQASKLILNDSLNIAIEDSSAKYLESADGSYHSYTFLAFNYDEPQGFDNVLLSLQPDGTYREFLFHYDLTDSEIELFNNNEYVNLEGKVFYAELGSNTFAGDVFSKLTVDENCLIWDVTGTNCTAGGNHEYGETCNGNPDEQPTEDGGGSQLVGIDWGCIDGLTGGGPTGSEGGDTASNGPLSGAGGTGGSQIGVSATNPPCTGAGCPIADDSCQEINDRLNNIINDPNVSSKMAALKVKVDSQASGNRKEDGARFTKIGDSFSEPREPTIKDDYEIDYNPNYIGNESVSVHIHQTEFGPVANPSYNSPIFSQGDLLEFLDNVKHISNTNSTLAQEVTAILITEEGTFALTVGDVAGALAIYNELVFPDKRREFKYNFYKNVIKQWKEGSIDNNKLIKKFKKFMKTDKTGGAPLKSAIKLLKAETDANGNITGWTGC